MRRLIEKKYILKQNLILILGFCLSVYFCYHLLTGERSYFRYQALEKKITVAEKNLEKQIEERAQLEQKVVMLRPDTLNHDLLEERVKHVLGFTMQGEAIILK